MASGVRARSTVDQRRLADDLWRAARLRRSISPLTDRRPDLGLAEAYDIQRALVARHEEHGERVVGAKLGFTSRAMQESFGISEPNFGRLTDAMFLDEGLVSLDELIHPRVEPEIAFQLGDELRGPGVTPAAVLRVTDALLPCLEVVDSRYTDYRFKLPDNTADNSSAARVRVGDPVNPRGIDTRLTGIALDQDGVVLATSTGAAALGDPAAAVAWLANRLACADEGLQPGDIVISGGLTRTFPLRSCRRLRAAFDGLGSVSIAAVGTPSEPEDASDR